MRTEAHLCWDGASKRALARRLSRKHMCDAGDPRPGLATAVIAAEVHAGSGWCCYCCGGSCVCGKDGYWGSNCVDACMRPCMREAAGGGRPCRCCRGCGCCTRGTDWEAGGTYEEAERSGRVGSSCR